MVYRPGSIFRVESNEMKPAWIATNFNEPIKHNSMLSSFQENLKACLILLLNVYIIFWVSVLLYGTFNYYYLPVAYQDHPVNFHFRVCDSGTGICSFLTANMSLFRLENQNEIFKRGQSYKIVLDLELPETDVNKQIGMFMIELKLYNHAGEIVHTSQRTTSLNYKSFLLETLETLFFAPFFLFGYMAQKQTIHVEFFSSFLENTYNPAVGALIEIRSQSIHLYRAKLKIFTQFSGIRYLLYYWPVTSAVIGVSWIFMFLSFVALLSWYQFRNKTPKKESAHVLARIDMPWKRQKEIKQEKALVSPDEMSTEECETIGAMPESDETSLLSPGQETGLRQRKVASED